MKPFCSPWKSLPCSPQLFRDHVVHQSPMKVTIDRSNESIDHLKSCEVQITQSSGGGFTIEDIRPNKRRGCSPNATETVANIVIHEEGPHFSRRDSSQRYMEVDRFGALRRPHHRHRCSPIEPIHTHQTSIQEPLSSNCLSIPTTIKRTRSLVVRETSPRRLLDSSQEPGMRSKTPTAGHLHRSQSFTFSETLIRDSVCTDSKVQLASTLKHHSVVINPISVANEATDDVFTTSSAFYSPKPSNQSAAGYVLSTKMRPFPLSHVNVLSVSDSLHSSATVSGYESVTKEHPTDSNSTTSNDPSFPSTSSSDFLMAFGGSTSSCSNFKKRLRDRYFSSTRETSDSAISSPNSTMLDKSMISIECNRPAISTSNSADAPLERPPISLLERRRNSERSGTVEYSVQHYSEKCEEMGKTTFQQINDSCAGNSSSNIKVPTATPLVACLQYLTQQQSYLSRPLYNMAPVNTPILEGINSYINRICRIESTSSNLSTCSTAFMDCESDPFSPAISPYGHQSIPSDSGMFAPVSLHHLQQHHHHHHHPYLSAPAHVLRHSHQSNTLPEVVISNMSATLSTSRPSPHPPSSTEKACIESTSSCHFPFSPHSLPSFPSYTGKGSYPQQHFIFPPPSPLLREFPSHVAEYSCPNFSNSRAQPLLSPDTATSAAGAAATSGDSTETLRNITALDLTSALSTAKLHRHSKLTWKRRLHSMTSVNFPPFPLIVESDTWDRKSKGLVASTSLPSSSNCPHRIEAQTSIGMDERQGNVPNVESSSTSTGTSLYICSHCSRTFTRSDMLARHVRLHTGHKPYECSECDQKFSRSDHLSTHLRTHTGVKPYECSQCSYTACRKDMITRHMRVHSRKGGRGRSHRPRSSVTSSNALHPTISISNSTTFSQSGGDSPIESV